jgi:hypothetical protein
MADATSCATTESPIAIYYIERRLPMAQEVESVARVGRLRQSVLKSAIEGRLG